jgi:hypothetical protein
MTMQTFRFAALVFAAAGLCAGQPRATSTLQGTVTGSSAVGAVKSQLAGATIRARDTKTNSTAEGHSGADGAYQVKLKPGTYDIFISAAGHLTFSKRAFAITEPSTKLDAVLTASLNEGTPGELTYLHLGDEHPVTKGPTPMTREGHPDLSGVWFPGLDLEPEEVPFLPWAAEYNRTHTTGNDPRGQCLPTGVARGQQSDLAKFVQTPQLLVMLVEGSPPGFRQIFLDGRKVPANLEPAWMGYSIGHWEGKGPQAALVVETTGFNDRAWIDFNRTPQTEKLKVTERFQRLDRGRLDLLITIDDPGAYSRPWHLHRILRLAPNEEIQEYICNENNDASHLR